MTPIQINDMLKNYIRCKARIQHLTNELSMMNEIRTDEMNQEMAVKYASGYIPQYIREWDKDIVEVKAELFEMEKVIFLVNSWLLCLTDKERFIIEEHIIKKIIWEDVLDGFNKRFIPMSKEGLRKMQKRALKKIYDVTR